MNHFYKKMAATLAVMSMAALTATAQNVGIGTNTPHPSAKLHIEDPNRGILVPSVSIPNVAAPAPVAAPAQGLLVWNSNAATTGGNGIGFYYWDGAAWTQLSTSSGTDDQNLTNATLTGNNLTIAIENGNPVTVDLTALVNDADNVVGNEYNTNIALTGTNLTITDGGGNQTVNLASLVNDADNVVGNEYNTGVTLTGNNLNITDGGGTQTVDLTSLVNDADNVVGNEYNTGVTLTGTNLNITDGGGTQTVDLTSLVNDADNVVGNEYNTAFALTGNNLTITDGGGPRTVDLSALNKSGRNGLRNVGNFIHLGGPLIENTTVSAGNFAMNLNLNGTGDFNIQDNGVNVFTVLDIGTSRFGGDVEWRDASTTGTLLANLIDDGDDGRFTVRENGGISVDLDANSQFVFNEQGLDRDFRVETDIDPNAFRVDAGNNRIGVGTGAPAEDFHVFRADNDIARVYATGATQGSGMFYAGQSPTFGGGFGYDGDGAPAMIGGVDRITFFRRDNNIDTEVLSYAYNNSTVRVNSLAGAGNRMVIANANGDLFTQAIPANGDITGVNAGPGLTGGGTVGTVTLNAAANNGLTVNAGADRIQLGGALIQNTVVTAGNFAMDFNLSGTGDFNIQDNGINHFTVLDNGTIRFGGDVEWRDENTGGTLLANLFDDGDDGRFTIRENGGVSVDLDANSQFIFNEQGLDRNTRIESDGNANMLFVDAGTNRVGVGNGAPSEALHVTGTARATTGLLAGTAVTRGAHTVAIGAAAPSIQFGNIGFNNAESGRLTFEENLPNYTADIADFCGFQVHHDGAGNTLSFSSDCGTAVAIMTMERAGDVGISTNNPTADLSVNGTANKTGGGNWAVFSDARLKKNITDYKEGLDLITKVRTVNFSYNSVMDEIWGVDERNKDRVYQGVIAQELQQIAPDMVREVTLDNKANPADADNAGTTPASSQSYLEVDPNKFTYALINAVQEQQAQIEALKKEVEALKAAQAKDASK